jgi:hypothetical protein
MTKLTYNREDGKNSKWYIICYKQKTKSCNMISKQANNDNICSNWEKVQRWLPQGSTGYLALSPFFCMLITIWTWSLTLREEHILSAFENRILRRIFGPKRDEVTGEWRKLHSEELHIVYSSPNIIRHIKSRRMRWAWHVARMGEERMCTGFWWKSQKERDHLKDQGVDGIRMDPREIDWGSVHWIQVVQDRDQWRALVNTVMNLWVLAPRS